MLGHFLLNKARLRMSLILVVLPIIALGAVVVAAQDIQITPELTPNEPTAGVLTREGDTVAQVFTFEAQTGDNVTITATSNDGLALALLLTDAQGNFVAQARDLDGVGQAALNASLTEGGLHYVTVLPVVGLDTLAEGTYALVLEVNGAAGTTGDASPVPSPTPEPTLEGATVVVTAPVVETPLEATQEPAPVVVTTAGMQVTLTWSGAADMNLEVRDPVGNTLYAAVPTSDFGGSFGPNVNVNCENVVTQNAVETANWPPGGIPTGSYEILIYYTQACEGQQPITFTIGGTVDGQELVPVQGTLLPQQVYIASYVVNADGSAVMSTLNGVREEQTLPASAAVLISSAQPMAIGETVTGTITSDQPFQTYSFTAAANTIVTIALNATSRSLDPEVAVLDPSGNVLYSNDDAAQGITDALLSNSLLAIDGVYTIVATRYGGAIGGTEGDFNLTLTSATDAISAAATVVAQGGTPQVDATTPTVGEQTLPAEVVALALPEGNIEVTLLWNTNADLQLLVRDPAGEAVFDDAPTIRSGGQLAAAGNVGCTASQTTPVSYIYWPTNITPRAGAYEIDVWFQNECNDPTPVSFTLYASVNGQPVLTQSVTTADPFLVGEHYVTSFTINQDGTVVSGAAGITGLESLNWEAEAASAFPMIGGDSVNGSITPTNKFDLYAFDGLAGDIVTISMTAAPGVTLDPKLYLIGPTGSVVAQNDDAVVGENRNSIIANFALPEDGQYIIIATHYGEQYGITSGAYTLSLDL